jgi:Flp pilus assembly protein TadD
MRRVIKRSAAWTLALSASLAAGCSHLSLDAFGAADSQPELGDTQVADMQVALGRTLESRGTTGQALPVYQEAVKNDPARADAWVRLAIIANKEGQFVEAAEHFQKALELQPDNPDIHCNLGYSLYLQQRWAEAEQALRRATELKPDHKKAHNNLGLVLGRLGREAESLEAFRQAGCSEADAHLNLAYTLVLSSSWKQARAHYEAALALEPSSEQARKGLEGLNTLAARMGPSGSEPVVQAGGIVPTTAANTGDTAGWASERR